MRLEAHKLRLAVQAQIRRGLFVPFVAPLVVPLFLLEERPPSREVLPPRVPSPVRVPGRMGIINRGRAVPPVPGEGRQGGISGHGGYEQDEGGARARPLRHQRPRSPPREAGLVRLDGHGHRGAQRYEEEREGEERAGLAPQVHEGSGQVRPVVRTVPGDRAADHAPPAGGADAALVRGVQRLDQLQGDTGLGGGGARGDERPRHLRIGR